MGKSDETLPISVHVKAAHNIGPQFQTLHCSLLIIQLFEKNMLKPKSEIVRDKLF